MDIGSDILEIMQETECSPLLAFLYIQTEEKDNGICILQSKSEKQFSR